MNLMLGVSKHEQLGARERAQTSKLATLKALF